MKLKRIEPESNFILSTSKALHKLLNHPAPPMLRPCQDCTVSCPCSSSIVCGCNCSPECEHLATSLTSDPSKYPIETEIIPLVYALGCLEGCDTYWSCAGHEDKDGNLFKIPRAWFYTRSVVHVRLIQQHVATLSNTGKLNYSWFVRATFSDFDNLDTGFSIEPENLNNSDMKLDQLHQDIVIIAKNMVANVKKEPPRNRPSSGALPDAYGPEHVRPTGGKVSLTKLQLPSNVDGLSL